MRLLWVAVAAWLAQGVVIALAQSLTLHLLRRPPSLPLASPPVLVVVPVRGPVARLERFLRSLAAQDHPDWRVVFAVEAAADQAVPLLSAFIAADPARRGLVVAGAARRRGQKVHNLLAGLAALRPGDAALVTIDADQVLAPTLLRALLRPLLAGRADIATGYRWSLPADGRWGSIAVAQVDAALASLPRPRRPVLCWGGATAIGRAALGRLDLPVLWDRAVSDDLTLGQAAAALGLRVHVALAVRVASPAGHALPGAMEFGVRQYRMTRLHAPGLWWFAWAMAVLPVLGIAASLAVDGGMVALALALGIGRWRVSQRRRTAALVLPRGAARLFARMPVWAPALGAVVGLAAVVVAGFGRVVVWAGRRYRIDAAGQVEPPD